MDAFYDTLPFVYTAFAAMVLLALSALVWFIGEGTGVKRLADVAVVGAGLGAVILVGSMLSDSSITPAHQSSVVNQTYNLNLDMRQLDELRAPVTPPSGAPTVYGSTEVPAEGLTAATIRLAWDGKRLLLVDERGAELPRH